MLIFREDIGRHNAVDKVIGAYLVKQNSFKDSILLTSGWLSLERELNITLIGFARDRRMNIYSGE